MLGGPKTSALQTWLYPSYFGEGLNLQLSLSEERSNQLSYKYCPARLALAPSYTEEKFLRLRVYLVRHDSLYFHNNNCLKSLFVFLIHTKKQLSKALTCFFVAICARYCVYRSRAWIHRIYEMNINGISKTARFIYNKTCLLILNLKAIFTAGKILRSFKYGFPGFLYKHFIVFKRFTIFKNICLTFKYKKFEI